MLFVFFQRRSISIGHWTPLITLPSGCLVDGTLQYVTFPQVKPQSTSLPTSRRCVRFLAHWGWGFWGTLWPGTCGTRGPDSGPSCSRQTITTGTLHKEHVGTTSRACEPDMDMRHVSTRKKAYVTHRTCGIFIQQTGKLWMEHMRLTRRLVVIRVGTCKQIDWTCGKILQTQHVGKTPLYCIIYTHVLSICLHVYQLWSQLISL